MAGTERTDVPTARPGRGLEPLDNRLAPEVRALAEYMRELLARTCSNSTTLASQLGISPSGLSRYLSGKRPIPPVWFKSFQDWVAENLDTGLGEQERRHGRELLYATAGVRGGLAVHEIDMARLEERWAEEIVKLELAINDTRSELTAERENRQWLEQTLSDSNTHNAEQFEIIQRRITELEERLSQHEALLGLLRAERLSFAEMAARSSATLAAYESGTVTNAPAASAPAETNSSPQDFADRVSRLLMDGHIEEVDHLLTGEAQRMVDPREFLITMGCLRQNDCYREAKFLSTMVGQRWTPNLLAQLLAMRADKKNQDLLTSGHTGHSLNALAQKDEHPLVYAVGERQDNELVELAERLRGKHLDEISTVILVIALCKRSRPARKALLEALRAAGLGKEASAAKERGPRLEHGWNPVEERRMRNLLGNYLYNWSR